MAERRMFSKTIIDSDAFTDMPATSRLLYYDLAMRADDDGFVNSPKKIMRIVGASTDDLLILVDRGFIIPFKSGLIVITHWQRHNYIRKDRYHPTVYQEEYHSLTIKEKTYVEKDSLILTDGQPSVDQISVDQRSTENRQEQESLDLDSCGYTHIIREIKPEEVDLLYDSYENAGDLIQAVFDDVRLKKKKVKNIYRYIVGYANNNNWPRKRGGSNGSQV
ncbi:MAG: replisome organizer [Oscillospiraceae bacterium]|nr:replisome organizer [Oscillospiraceae bacterium]